MERACISARDDVAIPYRNAAAMDAFLKEESNFTLAAIERSVRIEEAIKARNLPPVLNLIPELGHIERVRGSAVFQSATVSVHMLATCAVASLGAPLLTIISLASTVALGAIMYRLPRGEGPKIEAANKEALRSYQAAMSRYNEERKRAADSLNRISLFVLKHQESFTPEELQRLSRFRECPIIFAQPEEPAFSPHDIERIQAFSHPHLKKHIDRLEQQARTYADRGDLQRATEIIAGADPLRRPAFLSNQIIIDMGYINERIDTLIGIMQRLIADRGNKMDIVQSRAAEKIIDWCKNSIDDEQEALDAILEGFQEMEIPRKHWEPFTARMARLKYKDLFDEIDMAGDAPADNPARYPFGEIPGGL